MRPCLESHFPIWECLATTLPGGIVSKRSIERCRNACNQGTVFFERRLPELGKAIYKSLETGLLESPEWCRTKHGTPEFLRELLCRLYNHKGELRDPTTESSILRLKKVLQLTMLFYKVERAASHDVADDVVNSFLLLQPKLERIEQGWTEEDRQFLRRANRRLCKVLKNYDTVNIVPRHGPGAVFEGHRPHEKWQPFMHYPEIDKIYPDGEYQYVSLSHLCDQGTAVVGRTTEPKVRIVTVPKNADTVRMIAVEERYPQFLKLGLMDSIYAHVKNSHIGPYVQFDDQTTNHLFAEIGSIDRFYATLDLSAASDTVSLALAKRLIPAPILRKILPLRATKARYKGVDHSLSTFATMGSALCFPIEALVFWAICAESCGSSNVIVFGDDIIVPTDKVEKVICALETFGMVVSGHKSYIRGFFRESCGEDFYRGYPISVAKWRVPLDTVTDTIAVRTAFVGFLNDLGRRWGLETAETVYHDMVRRFSFIPGTTKRYCTNYAVLLPKCPAANDSFLRRKWCSHTQVWKYRILVDRPLQRRVPDTWTEVFRSLTGSGSERGSSLYDDPKRMTRVWTWCEL